MWDYITYVYLLTARRTDDVKVCCLESEYVEGGEGGVTAVPALDPGPARRVLRWHRRLLDLLVVELPNVRHVHHAHPAQRTGVVAVVHHLVKTRLVDQVVARWDLNNQQS